MAVPRSETAELRTSADVVRARQLVRTAAADLGFSLVEQTKLVTAASELARNTIDYGKGGEMTLELLDEGNRRGIRLRFADQGPGIPDVERALTDGYTSGNGMGLGLGGARRLVNEFEIDTRVGEGTRVTVVRWK
jgi:serine/threonine-protein kinase RsbT